MLHAKILVTLCFVVFIVEACYRSSSPAKSSIADNKSYAASLFRQNCAVCHGPEADGRSLDDGKVVPSLRKGEFKFKTDEQIYNQIANGGNGMPPFRDQLTDREVRMLVDFVQNDLRKTP